MNSEYAQININADIIVGGNQFDVARSSKLMRACSEGKQLIYFNCFPGIPTCTVTEYLDPHNIWTPGPQFTEIFGPP